MVLRLFSRLILQVAFASAFFLPSVLEGQASVGSSGGPAAPPSPVREFRGAWVTPIGGAGLAEWLARPGQSIAQQKAELREMLDKAKAAGVNVIIFHVRIAGDALYKSSYTPWSVYLTGISGQDPGYDPLEYVIEEAHARGMHLHAWFNPFRAMLPNFRGRAAPDHVTNSHPSWIVRYGSQTWIDPGEPAARADIMASIVEVVRKYDVDGVHIDDYFYPYKETDSRTGRLIDFPDNLSWTRYGVGSRYGQSRDDWRRHNVDEFVQTLYNSVKQEKPWVAVGVSPFGIWRPGSPPGITGLDAFGQLYADSRKWLQSGWAYYFAPQIYWPRGSSQPRFLQLNRWWIDPEQNPLARHIWPGLATMHWGKPEWGDTEIPGQIEVIRELHNSLGGDPGHAHFRLSFFDKDGSAVGRHLRATVYTEDAIPPAYPWLSDATPKAPIVDVAPSYFLHVPLHVAVSPADTVAVRWWLVQIQDSHGRWTSQVYRAIEGRLTYFIVDGITSRSVSVRAVNRAGVESPATVILF